MSWREKLADWISGGELTRARQAAEIAQRQRDQWETKTWQVLDKMEDMVNRRILREMERGR